MPLPTGPRSNYCRYDCHKSTNRRRSQTQHHLFRNTKEGGTTTRRDDYTNKHAFYGIVPDKAAMPLGQITLPVTFGTPSNYRIEFIKFEVADFDSSYHAILGRPALAKFMAIPHYPYLLLKMPGPNGVLSLRSDLKRAFDCDVQAIQIASKA